MQQLQSDGSYNELYPKTDAWTKDETLSAQVASVLGLRDNYKPDDAFLGLYFGAGTYRYRIRVILEDGTPVQGSTISGIEAIQGQSLVTNEQGYVLGKSTSQSVTISCTTPFIDQKGISNQVIQSTGIITDFVLTLQKITSVVTITSSQKIVVSSLPITMDIGATGGGGGGGGGCNSYSSSNTSPGNYDYRGAGGGGSGYYNQVLNVSNINDFSLQIQIGSGGNGSTYNSWQSGGNGRVSSVTNLKDNSIIVSANRGGRAPFSGITGSYPHSRPVGGTGSKNGGAGAIIIDGYRIPEDGKSSTTYIFNNVSYGYAIGRSGGGGSAHDTDLNEKGSGGTPGGGDGEYKSKIQYSTIHTTAASNGSYYGAGGGGGASEAANSTTSVKGYGGNGAAGAVFLLFHFS